jgi:plasmid stabilization system protein ParE
MMSGESFAISPPTTVAARGVGRELLLAGDSLVRFPRRGRPGRLAGTRELMAIHPYLIVYRVAGADMVTILRVWHAAQERPGSD